jgi:hypothetical protein
MPNFRQRLLDFLSSDTDDDIEEPGEAEITDDGDADGDGTEGDEFTEGDGEEGDGTEGDGEEGTGDDADGGGTEEPAEVAELRAMLTEQGALIESLRNQVAELGGVPIEDEIVEEDDDTAEPDDEDVVDEFEADYAVRQARLAEITEGN